MQAEEAVLQNGHVKRRRIDPMHLTLFRHVLMFYGLSLECYLKACLVKSKTIEPVDLKKNPVPQLSDAITKHNLIYYFTWVFGVLTEEEAKTLGNLTRAILSGKYLIEKNATNLGYSYSRNFDMDIRTTKKIIKRLKIRLDFVPQRI